MVQIRFLRSKFDIIPIIRTRTERFQDTVQRDAKVKNFTYAINTNFYAFGAYTRLSTALTSDPSSAEEIRPEGHIIREQMIIAGSSRPDDYYLSFNRERVISGKISDAFSSGIGNPPINSTTAIGGLGPIIINGLKYGIENKYSEDLPNAIQFGEPSPTDRLFLTQRSSKKFSSFASRGRRVGKTCIGVSNTELTLLVQRHGDPEGQTLEEIRDYFFDRGCVHAVFFDGSDSAMFFENGKFLVSQGENKDETCVAGVGFVVW